jgi:hypothetical protein
MIGPVLVAHLDARFRTRWRDGRPRGADFSQQPLGFIGGLRIELIGQHGAATLIGLNRHAPLTARGIGAHQRPPGALMGAVDRQQLLGSGNHRLRFGFLAQQHLGERPGTVAQSFALAGQPCVKAGVDPVQILQQVAIQQRQRGGSGGRGAQHFLHVHPHCSRAQREMVAINGDDLGTDRVQRLHQPVDFLAQ